MINIDLSRDSLFDEFGLNTLKNRYLAHNETSPQERFRYVCFAFSSDEEHAQRMYDYASKHWVSFSTPILSFGKGGLPISCFLPYLADTKESLVNTSTECRQLSMSGGGIGLRIGLRSKGDKSTGIMAHLKTYDADTLAYRQGNTRRGSMSVELSIDHPEIFEFLEMRKPTGGDPDLKCRNLHHTVNIPDSFMNLLDSGDSDDWNLIDPHTKKVTQTVSARRLWERILESRHQTGEPFIHWVDNSNRKLPESQKKLGLSIKQTNLCTEILLPTDEERTAVCCLSSVNAVYYDEWKNHPQFIGDIVEFLDNVLQLFIVLGSKNGLTRAAYSAERERSIGIGILGFHEYLLNNEIPFESAGAINFSRNIARNISDHAQAKTRELAKTRGPCPDSSDDDPVRNMRLMAIAPNASTSIIMGNTSPSIEPYAAMAYAQKTLTGMHIHKVKAFKNYLNKNYPEQDEDAVFRSIAEHQGSVQHLDFLNEFEKELFKTAREIDQRWIIDHAVHRNNWIDQGQSLNTFWYSNTNIKEFHDVHMRAWRGGLSTMYYARSANISQAANVSKQVERKKITVNDEECLACQ